MSEPLTKTLIFEIALPDFYAEDLDPNSESLREFYGEEGAPLTAEQMYDAVSNESGMISGRHVRVVLLTGGKGGDELQRLDGWIVGVTIVDRTVEHEGEKDERLDDYEEAWVQREARRMSRG